METATAALFPGRPHLGGPVPAAVLRPNTVLAHGINTPLRGRDALHLTGAGPGRPTRCGRSWWCDGLARPPRLCGLHLWFSNVRDTILHGTLSTKQKHFINVFSVFNSKQISENIGTISLTRKHFIC